MEKYFKIAVIMIVVSIILIVASKLVESNNQEDKLKNKLYILGATYYENIYYNNASTSEIEKYYYDGMRVNLKKLIDGIYYDDPKEFINNKTGLKCDYLNSYVVIFPYSPYKKENYNVKVNLDCGF